MRPSRRRPAAYTHLLSAAPPVRARARAPLTQPHRRYIRCCVVRPRHARSHGLPGPVLALHECECEAEKQAAQDAADLRRDASRSRAQGGKKMNLILTCSRRWRGWRPMSPRRRRHDQAGVYAPREGAVAVSRRRRLRGAGRRLQARARRTVASTSTRKPPASRSSTHGYVLTTSPRCGTRAWLVDWERHAPTSYGPSVAASGGCSC